VALAGLFLPRIVGLRAGEIVYDGPASGLTPEILTRIYGEEDWTKTATPESAAQDQPEDAVVESLDLAVAAR
jgi:phosphonate transport system ATP-binding protein